MNTHIKTWLGTTIIIIMAITAGMFVWKVYEINNISVSAPQTIKTPKKGGIVCTGEAKACSDGSYVSRTGPNCEFAPCPNENNLGMANPASVFCEQNGGTLEIVTATDGSQSGMCKFSDGSQCEEWAFQRGECKIGDSQKQDSFSDYIFTTTDGYYKKAFKFSYPSSAEIIKDQYIQIGSEKIVYKIKGKSCWVRVLPGPGGIEGDGDQAVGFSSKTTTVDINGQKWSNLIWKMNDKIILNSFKNIDDSIYGFDFDTENLDICFDSYNKILSTFKFTN